MAKNRSTNRRRRNDHQPKSDGESQFMRRALKNPGVTRVVFGRVHIRPHRRAPGTVEIKAADNGILNCAVFSPGRVRHVFVTLTAGADNESLRSYLRG